MLFNSSLLSAIRVVSSAYLRLLIFLPEILIPACDSSSLAFHMMCSSYKLNKQGDNIQPWCLFSQFGTSPLFHVQFCFFLTCIQLSQEAGKVVWYSHFLKSFPQFVAIHIVKGFGVVNKAEVDAFLKFPAYLKLLIFLPAILIPPCDSSRSAFCMMYSACKLKQQGDSIQPWCTPFSILYLSQFVVPCPVLTVASCPAYRFLRRQVRWSGIPISWRIFHSLLWSAQSKVSAQSMKQK